MNILFSGSLRRDLQILDAESRAEDQREEAENERTSHRRKSTNTGENEEGGWKVERIL